MYFYLPVSTQLNLFGFYSLINSVYSLQVMKNFHSKCFHLVVTTFWRYLFKLCALLSVMVVVLRYLKHVLVSA